MLNELDSIDVYKNLVSPSYVAEGKFTVDFKKSLASVLLLEQMITNHFNQVSSMDQSDDFKIEVFNKPLENLPLV